MTSAFEHDDLRVALASRANGTRAHPTRGVLKQAAASTIAELKATNRRRKNSLAKIASKGGNPPSASKG